MENEIIEARVAKLWVGEDGIVCNIFLPQAEVTPDEVKKIREINTELIDGTGTPFTGR